MLWYFPLYTISNNEDNICEYEFAFHIDENNEIICHPGLYCISDNKILDIILKIQKNVLKMNVLLNIINFISFVIKWMS